MPTLTAVDPESIALPTRREEAWRFTPQDRIVLGEPGSVTVEHTAPPEVSVTAVDRDDPRFGDLVTATDRYTALALARFPRGTLISVPRHVTASEPVTLRVHGEGGTAYGPLLVDVGDGAAVTVVVDHSGSGTFLANAEYRVGAGASLTVVSLQDWADDAVHVGTHAAELGRDARFRSIVVTLGGDLVRLSPSVRFTGPGADAELLGLFFADEGQHLEHRLLVDHAAPHCRSRVVYKGALQGEKAHSVWIGDVVIRHDAVGTDSYEVNRNLVLTDGARADSVPNLEIETGEVAHAGHASATGRFDDLQLFYLQSRGIPADEARRLVVRGFFAEVIEQIAVPELRARLALAIEDELARSVL